MKKTTLKDLKEQLSSIADKVSKGESFEVTKHGKPYFKMVPWQDAGVNYGKFWGKHKLKPVLSQNHTRGKALQYLLEDREDRF